MLFLIDKRLKQFGACFRNISSHLLFHANVDVWMELILTCYLTNSTGLASTLTIVLSLETFWSHFDLYLVTTIYYLIITWCAQHLHRPTQTKPDYLSLLKFASKGMFREVYFKSIPLVLTDTSEDVVGVVLSVLFLSVRSSCRGRGSVWNNEDKKKKPSVAKIVSFCANDTQNVLV